MPLVYDYIKEIDKWRDDLADNLTTKGVEAERTEKLNSLVPKVLEIPSRGGGAPLVSEVRFAAPFLRMHTVDETDFAAQVQFSASDCIGFEFEEETA